MGIQSVFKIRNTKTGLFSAGSSYARFNKKGKTWIGRQSLNGHLAMFDANQMRSVYKDCEVIEYELKDGETTGIEEVIERKVRLASLKKKYDEVVAGFCDRLIEKGKADEYRWLIAPQSDSKYATGKKQTAILSVIRENKIKRTNYLFAGHCFAFVSKTDAAILKLTLDFPVDTIDMKTFQKVPDDE